jgi:hypothetical protein
VVLAADPVFARLAAEVNPGAITLCLRSSSTRRGVPPAWTPWSPSKRRSRW